MRSSFHSGSIRTKLIFLGALLTVLSSSIIGLTLVTTSNQTMIKGQETDAIAFAVNTAKECAEPLRDGNSLALKDYFNSLRAVTHFGQQHIKDLIIIDNKADVIAQNNVEKPNRERRNTVIKQALNIEEPQALLVNKDNFAIVAPIERKGERLGTFIMNYDLGHVAESTRKMWKFFLLILIALTGVGVIGAFGFSNTIVAPIQKMVEATAKISKGDLLHRLEIDSKDELGELADSFNQMTKALQKTTVSKNYLDNIITSMADGLIVTDAGGKIKTANQATLDLFGYKEDELRDKPLDIFLAEGTLPQGDILKKLAVEGSIKNYEMIYRTKTGQIIPTLLSGSVMKDDEENIVGLIVIAKDITERKKAEEELRRHRDQLENMVEERTAELTAANEELQQEIVERRQIEEKLTGIARELEESNEELRQNQDQLLQSEKMASIGQLAAGVAHEINNPVGFINSNLTTLDEYREDLTELIQDYIKLEERVAKSPALSTDPELATDLEATRNLKDKIDLDFILDDFDKIISESKEGVERVKKIVQDLKDFSHVDQAERVWTDLNKGMESTLNIVWNELKYKTTVTKDYGDIPEVYCYPQRINQVFMNILVNAAHAIEHKGEIKIATRYLDGAEPMVEVRISDTGKGIPPENLPKIFDPFFTTKPVGKGTGLGLSMAYSIIKKHDGEIKVESEVGKGTTFIVTLPVKGPKGSEAPEGDPNHAG